MSSLTPSFDLSATLASIRLAGDKAKASAAAATKAQNAELPVGSRLPTMVIANHTKASAISAASASLIAALQAGEIVVKSAGKTLKSGDVNVRIGAPLASLEFVVAAAQEKALRSQEKRMVARFRKANGATTVGLTDDEVLTMARAAAAAFEAAKAAPVVTAPVRTTPAVAAPAPVKLTLRKAA